MDLNNCKIKFKALFEMFFKEDFELSNYFSENLLKHLEDRTDKRENIVDTPFISDLLISSVMDFGKASESVRLFIIKMIHIMLRNELQFSKISNLKGFQTATKNLFSDKNRFAIKSSPLLQLAAVNLCSSTITHSTGLNWHIEGKIWEKLLNSKITTSSIIEAEVHKFIAKLVWKLDDHRLEPALIELLNFCVSPIKNNSVIECALNEGIQVINVEDEKSTYAPIISRVKILLMVLSDSEHISRKNLVLPLLLNYFMIKVSLGVLLEIVRDSDLKHLILQTSFQLNFACSVNVDEHKEFDIAQKNVIDYCNVIAELTEKRYFKAALQFSTFCILLWVRLDHKTISPTFERHERTYNVINQFMAGIITPILSHSTLVHKHECSANDNFNVFYTKLTGSVTEQVFRVFCKAYLETKFFDKKVVIEAVKELYKLNKHLTTSQAAVIYQTLFYVLQNYIVTDEDGNLTVDENPVKCPVDIKLIYLILDLMKIILKDYNIKWYECVEIISLQTCLMNIVKQNLLPVKQLLQALDLIDLTIKKFLSPDLVLLMETRRGNTLNEIIVIIKNLLEQPQWELKDSALQILLSCTELAFIHYVPMQKLLQENNLMTSVAHIALTDEETYVQSAALRCLAAATKMGCIWNLIIETHPNINVQLIQLMNDKHDDLVRKEATNVISEIYTQRCDSYIFPNYLYNVMTSAAIEDLHWEVQLVALNFWKNAINNILSHRGMLYGKFPSTFFCKERRKIINLNETMIQQQIVKILNDLARTGCLKVINTCLNEDENIQVIETAYEIAKLLMSILDLYRFELVPQNMLNVIEEDNVCINDCDMTNSSKFVTNLTLNSNRQYQIVEEILNTKQSDLILLISREEFECERDLSENERTKFPVKKWFNPNEFITNFRGTDHLSIIEGKRNWNCGPKSLDALLDELLALGEVKKEFVEECG